MTIDIVIPLYNEEELVLQVLDLLEEVRMPDFISATKIIIVDDGSSDNSYSAVKKYIETKADHYSLLQMEKNSGKGAAVRYGIDHGNGELIFIQDADLELYPHDLPVMLEAMKNLKVEFVNGSRYLPGIPRPLSSYRRYLANRFFTWLTSIFINVKLTDMACGYKLFTRELYNKLHLKENRFGFEAEIILKALRIKKNNITEVPVNYFPRNEAEGKKFKSMDALKMLVTIFRYAFFK
ncbi:MAG: glycosyltransferase family 2 protein [Bacteroidales bacterium]|nr:glycosyltransferase family 2 protein [Bacteroidales bacterium]MCB8999712.1 glycosyltransferase family 2 protein [Bacteroidales bacterium]